MNEPEFVVYTDGASRKDGRGGWGWHALTPFGTFSACGGEYDTTNNRMELMGAIQALEEIDASAEDDEVLEIELWSDSQYVILGITENLVLWKLRRWRTSTNKPIKNVDLWQRLEAVAGRHNITWQWVKGHTGNDGNEKADKLAGQGIPPPKGEPLREARTTGDDLPRRPARGAGPDGATAPGRRPQTAARPLR